MNRQRKEKLAAKIAPCTKSPPWTPVKGIQCGTVYLWLSAVATGNPALAQDRTHHENDEPVEQISPSDLQRAVRRYSQREPSVERVVQAALRLSDLDPSKAQRTMANARLSGLVPTIRIGMRRGQARDLSEQQSATLDRTNTSVDNELSLQAWAAFQLGRLVYHPNEISGLREQRAIEAARRDLIHQIVSLYFERRRLQLEQDLTNHHNLSQQVRLQELTALLNALAGNLFRRGRQAETSQVTTDPAISFQREREEVGDQAEFYNR